MDRALLRITHVTRYGYGEPAWDSFNELCLRPNDDYRQTLKAFALKVDPKVELRSHRDAAGNLIHRFYVPQAHRLLEIAASSVVETYPVPTPLAVSASVLPGLRHRFFEFLAPTVRVPLDRDWHALLGASRLEPDGDLVAYVAALTAYLRERFRYAPNATEVDTPLPDFVAAGAGVCQDYAHAMLALCRLAGIPARYVSGYVHPHPHTDETLLGSGGSHAWVEAFLPGNGWVGFDPTNGCPVGEAHVKIGVGRDYDDVPPVRGLRRGGGAGTLDVLVRVRHVARTGSTRDVGVAPSDESLAEEC
ncbi:MAG: transglutaminase family protein [Trueperaceae bacterium]|nr:transglutaminase family protein [Trueperaceae bacterium]